MSSPMSSPMSSSGSSRHLLRRLVVLGLSVLTALVATVAFAGSAAAHVTVSSADAAPGGYGKLTFRVPNESDTASTVRVRIQIPPEAAMASLRAQPVPGWTVTMTRADLEEPIDSHGQEIGSYVSVVEFRADEGGIGPDEFQEFALSGGPFPDVEQVAFPAVQTYSDSSEPAWIEPTVDGQEPEHPAPVLSLASDGGAAAAEPVGAAAVGPAEEAHAGEHEASPGALALFLAILALLVALAGVVLGWRAQRRTVAS